MIIRNLHCLGQATAMTITAELIARAQNTTVGGCQPELLYRRIKIATNDIFSRMATEYIPNDNIQDTFIYLMLTMHSWLPKIGSLPPELVEGVLATQAVRDLVNSLPELKKPLLAADRKYEKALLTRQLIEHAIAMKPAEEVENTDYPVLYSLIKKVAQAAHEGPAYCGIGYGYTNLELDLGRVCGLSSKEIASTRLLQSFVCLFGTKGLQFKLN